jgi:uncharacterized protein (TIGR02246 family)
MKAFGICLFMAFTPMLYQQQLPKSQVFFQNTETDTASFGISCDNRQSWKPVTLKGHEGQRFECDSPTAKMWGHINTDIAGMPHQEAEVSFQNGSRYEVFFDQAAHKWNLRVMGAAGGSGTGSTNPGTNDEAAIRATYAAWIAAISGRNLAGITDLFTDDCVFSPSSTQQVSGKDEVRKYFEKKFSQYGNATIDAQGETQEVQIFGDTAVWRGTNSITVTSHGGLPNKSSGYEMGLLRRGSEGKWRFSRIITNGLGGN